MLDYLEEGEKATQKSKWADLFQRVKVVPREE